MFTSGFHPESKILSCLSSLICRVWESKPGCNGEKNVFLPLGQLHVRQIQSLRRNSKSYLRACISQENERYANPHKAFTYRMHGFESVVGPVKVSKPILNVISTSITVKSPQISSQHSCNENVISRWLKPVSTLAREFYYKD